jgi:SAM-dependent methyltransferase
MSVHEQAAHGFEAGAGAYERGRPDYPPAAIDWLTEQLSLRPGRVLADVGAGTGKLTRALLASGATVLAIEPVAGMRELLAREAPAARRLDGTAERLPLADSSVDAIVVAQAFHWFDGPRALVEFHRALRPLGRFALVWNRRRSEQSQWLQINAILDRYRGDTPSHASGNWRQALEATELFAPAGEFNTAFELAHDSAQLVDRITSTSFIAALDDARRSEVVEQVLALTASGPQPLVLGYDCEISLFERRD